jgi:ABC-2 type transport system ATP-binding protein
MIEFREVSKSYRIAQRRGGFAPTLKSLIFPRFTRIRAIQNLSLTIKEGELLGLIGENGAGKSTLVKMATGILRPDSGSITFDGLDVGRHRRECARKYGVVFGQRRSLWWQLSAREGLEALGRIYSMSSTEARARSRHLVDLFELGEFVDRPVRQLSLGQRVRCEVAACFMHRPKVVFLDEPTIGMDATAKIEMREYLRRINRKDGVAVLVTSHDLFDVERVCERVLILDSGVLILDDALESLRRKLGSERILRVTLASEFDSRRIEGIEGIELSPVDDKWKLMIRFDPTRRPVMELMDELQSRLDIADFTVEDLPIDEFVAGIYRSRSAGSGKG